MSGRPVPWPFAREFRKSGRFLRFNQTFERTLGRTENPEWRPMVLYFRRLMKDASGVTAIEYGLIAALIVITSIAALQQVSSSLNLSGTLGTVTSKL